MDYLPVIIYFYAFTIGLPLFLLFMSTVCKSFSTVSEWSPCCWSIYLSDSETFIPAFIGVCLLAIAFLTSFFNFYNDPAYNCPEFACTALRKLLATLMLVGWLLVIIMIFQALISSNVVDESVLQKFPLLAYSAYLSISSACYQFRVGIEFDDQRQYITNRRFRSSRECHLLLHASHLGDLGSKVVLMLPIFLMLVMLLVQYNPILVIMMLLCWYPLTICWDPMFSFRHGISLTEQWEAERVVYSQGFERLTFQSLLPYMSFSFPQRILFNIGRRTLGILSQWH